MEGVGISAHVIYAFSEHWGMSLSGAYARSISGTANAVAVGPTTRFADPQNSKLSLPTELSNFGIQGQLIYDPFSGDGFRLPVIVGAGVVSADQRTEDTFQAAGATLRASIKTDEVIPLFMAGLAPQQTVGPFRIIPFGSAFLFLESFQTTRRLENLTNGQASQGSAGALRPVIVNLGLSVKYLPWNLGFSYVKGGILLNERMKAFASDASLWTVTWDRAF